MNIYVGILPIDITAPELQLEFIAFGQVTAAIEKERQRLCTLANKLRRPEQPLTKF